MGGGSSKKKQVEETYKPSQQQKSQDIHQEFSNNYNNVHEIENEVSFIYGEDKSLADDEIANETSTLLFELIPFCGGPSSDQAEEMVLKILTSNQPLPRRPRDQNGSTLLMVAATSRAEVVVEALLNAVSNKFSKNNFRQD